MKVLFVLTEIGAAVPSYHSISILSAVIKSAGHDTSLLELPKLRLGLVDEAITQHDPAVVAITAVTQQIPYAKTIIAHVKQKFPHIQTVLGGTHAIVRPNVIEEIPELDAVATNESEGPILEYLACLEGGRPPIEVANFRVRIDGQVVTSGRTYTCDEAEMTALPFEDRELFPRWKNTPKGVPLESLGIRPRFFFSRGCAFACRFCSLPTLRKMYPEKKFVRYPTAERAIAEIEAVADRWTFSTWVADDDVMTHRPDWIVNEWANKYPDSLRHLKWELNLRVETATEEVMRALAYTGASLLKFGLESGDPDVRKDLYDRRITNERTKAVFALARKYGLKCHTFNIVGHWNETRRQVAKTVRLNQVLKPDKVQISILYPYPGTPIGDEAERLGLIVRHVNSYFEDTPLKLNHLHHWEVKAYFRFFRLAVYLAYSPRLAWGEIIGLAKWLRDKVRKRRTRYDLEAATTRTAAVRAHD